MKRLISEDDSMMNVQRQMTGQKTETPPIANQVKSFLKSNDKDKNYDAGNVKPYPLDKSPEVLSDMYLSSLNLSKILWNALENPALKKNHKHLINELIQKNDIIGKAIVDISNSIDTIG